MIENIRIEMPDKVRKIINILEKCNHEAFIVGGCVRDSILEIAPKDWDITTSAEPQEVIAIFSAEGYGTVPTGIKHGTITAIIESEAFEITTYRIDGEYTDSRRPSDVEFTKSLKEDLKRRDYTINAMAYNDRVGLVDYFNGREDIRKKLIRAVGNPNNRLKEDALRMMRAHRFSAQLGFDIEEETSEAIKTLSANIKLVSAERIREEFNKIILSDNPIQLIDLYKAGLLKQFFKELAIYFETIFKNQKDNVFEVPVMIKAIQELEKDLSLRLAIVFYYLSKLEINVDSNTLVDFDGYLKKSDEIICRVLRQLKYDNKTIESVLIIVKYYDIHIDDKKSIRRILNKIGPLNLEALIKVKEADIKAQNLEDSFHSIEQIHKIRASSKGIIESNQCYNIKDLAVKGEDIVKLGIAPGKTIGVILNKLLDLVIEDPDLNKKDQLLEKAKSFYDFHKDNL